MCVCVCVEHIIVHTIVGTNNCIYYYRVYFGIIIYLIGYNLCTRKLQHCWGKKQKKN